MLGWLAELARRVRRCACGIGRPPPWLAWRAQWEAQAILLHAARTLAASNCRTRILCRLCSQGVHVLVRLIKLSSPPETAFIADQVKWGISRKEQRQGGWLQAALLTSLQPVDSSTTAIPLVWLKFGTPQLCVLPCTSPPLRCAVCCGHHFVQVMHDLADMVTSKGGALVVCTLVDRLVSRSAD